MTTEQQQESIAVWSYTSTSGTLYYHFNLGNDKYIMFPQVNKQNPKAPKFLIKKCDKDKYNAGGS